MHLVIDCRWVRSREIDGIGRYTINIVRHMLHHIESSHGNGQQVTLLFDNSDLRSWVSSKINLQRFENVSAAQLGYSVMTPSDYLRSGWDIARLDPDVLFEPNYLTGAFHRTYNTVVVVHDLTPIVYYKEVCTTWRWKLLFGIPEILRTTFRWSKQIIAVSEHTQSDLHERFPVAKDKTSVVHEGGDPKFFETQSPEKISHVQSKYEIPSQYVLCVSRHESYKNLHGLAEAYRCLPSAIADEYPLVLTGSFHENWSPQLRRSMRDLIDADQAVFTGFVDDEDLPAVYQGATLFCLPSKYEGFGLPLLEAMASECPIAASNRASIPEVAGSAAEYFNPESPEDIASVIGGLLERPRRRSQLVEKGRTRVRSFSWKDAAQDLLRICYNSQPK